MPVFTIETPSGKQLDIEAGDEATALRGAQEWEAGQVAQGGRDARSVAGKMFDNALGFSEGQVAGAMAKTAGAPSAAPSFMDTLRGSLGYSGRTLGYMGREARRGLSMMAGAPVDITALTLRALGLPSSTTPIGGSASIDKALGGFGLIPEPSVKPDPFQRVAGRVAMEIGANAVPVMGAMARGASMGLPAARALANAPRTTVAPTGPISTAVRQEGQDIADTLRRMKGQAYEAGAIDPAGLLGREAGYATTPGVFAGLANESVGAPQHGDNFKSDFMGSLLGVLTHGTATAALGAGRNLGAAALGRPEMMDQFAREEVANRLINNSSLMQDRFATTGRVDTTPLVEMLNRPAAVEEAIPGYVANIGDRTRDPGLTSFAYNTDTALPGAAAARRTGNEMAVEGRLQELAPEGDAGQFRSALENARTQELAGVQQRAEEAGAFFDTASRDVQPGMADATARGSSLRAALQDASDATRAQVERLWAPINRANEPVDVAPLVEQFGRVEQGLAQNELRRFQPPEAGLPAQMAEQGAQPLREITGIRSGLSDSILAAPAGSNEQRILRQYRDALDQFVEQSVPEALRADYDAARAATRDFKERFTRPGEAVSQTLQRREGGGYQMDPSAVPSRFTPTNQGRLTDFRSLMREAGQDPRARGAVADQIFSEAQSSGALKSPQAMTDFLSQRSIVLGEMPEVRRRLENAGFAKAVLDDAEKTAAETTTRLTTPGRSATASYLKYGDERTVDAIRTVTNAGKPAEAARELIAQAGGSEEARAGLRDAFWRDVQQSGKDSAKTMTGGDKWNGRKLNAFLNDPKRMAVAEELWSDRPEELANIRQVFEALAGAEGSVRARAPGSSGTAQALNGKFDPALTASSLMSRGRSVKRHQMSPAVAGVDIIATYLRKRQVQVQQRAIDTLTSTVVNNPELAAELLARHNPVDLPARKRLLTQKYGIRGTQIGNLLDEAQRDNEGR